MQAWHCAITKPYAGSLAEEQLKEQGFEVFNPVCITERTVRGKKTEVIKPYLPGYIFVRFDASEDAWQPIHYTRGIKALICATPERPIPISEKAMAVLLDQCDGQMVRIEKVDEALDAIIDPGATVKMRVGPFASFEGVVKWTHGDRLRVLLNVFGRQCVIKTERKHVELVSGA